MKSLYLLLALSALGLSASAANGNAEKLFTVHDKTIPSFWTHLLPTPDGGAYLFYQPRQIMDSVLLTRLDEHGNISWSKNILNFYYLRFITTTSDNGFVIEGIETNAGYCVLKIDNTGNSAYAYKLAASAPDYAIFDRAADGTFTAATTGTQQVIYPINASGLATHKITIAAEGGDFTNPYFSAAVHNSSTNVVLSSVVYEGKLALIKSNGMVPAWAKTYAIGGSELAPNRLLQLSDGNILVCGTNLNQDTPFIAKINSTTGNVMFMKQYIMAFGPYLTTETHETFSAQLTHLDQAMEMPDGSITLGGVVSYKTGGYFQGQYSAVMHISASGTPLETYYVGGNVRYLDAMQPVPMDGYRLGNLVNLSGADGGYYIEMEHPYPLDSNNTTLVPLNELANVCGIRNGTPVVKDLTAATANFAVTLSLGGLPDTVQVALADNTMDITSTELCLSQSVTGIKEINTNTLSITPNPAKAGTELLVNIGNTDGLQQLNITDLTGKLVFSKKGLLNENKVNPGNLAKGSYLVQVTGTGGTITRQLIITD